MVYLIAEDSGSGYGFWVSISAWVSKQICVKTCHGYNGAMKSVCSIKLKSKDEVVFILDKIEKDDTVYEAYSRAREHCLRYGVKVSYVDIYCFEEILLSFRYLYAWCDYGSIRKSGKEEETKVARIVRKCIYSGEDYTQMEEIQRYMRSKGISFSEESVRERFAYYILNSITYGSSFSYKKGNLSPCYYKDCCIMKYPKHCGIKKNGWEASGNKKVRAVYRNSIMSRKKILIELFGGV
jgi:hypothetical protein